MTKRNLSLSLILIVATTLLSASLAYAQGFTIGSGATININNGTLNVSNDIVINGTLVATTGTINGGGNWTNNGTFMAGTGMVNLIDGQSPANVSGNTQFYNLSAATNTGKQINFQVSSTQTVTNTLTLQGTAGNLLVLRSTISGQQAMIDLQAGGTQTIAYVDVKDHSATGQHLAPGPPSLFNSVESGNNSRWFENYGPSGFAVSGYHRDRWYSNIHCEAQQSAYGRCYHWSEQLRHNRRHGFTLRPDLYLK